MSKFKTFLHSHPHFVSFIATTLSFVLVDAIAWLSSQEALVIETAKTQAIIIIIRSCFKTIMVQIAPTAVSTTTTTTSTDQTIIKQ